MTPKRPRDPNQLAKSIIDIAPTGQAAESHETGFTKRAMAQSALIGVNGSLAGGLRRSPQPPHAAERLIDQRPEQQHDRKRRDRADQTVRPEHFHVAARSDHRQPERVLGTAARPSVRAGLELTAYDFGTRLQALSAQPSQVH